VVVFASLTGSLDDAIEVGRLSSQAIRLNTDATKTFKVDVTMPDVAGQYTLLAAVQPESSIPDADLSNNLLIGDEVSVRDAFVDLAASIESSQLEDDQDAGDRGKAIVSLGNVGNINARGKAVIQLFAVSDELGVEPVLIGEQSVNIKLNAGADKSFKVRYELPASLRGGDYELAAVATATDGNVDENAGNDEATAAASFSVHNGDLTPTEITASFGGAQLTGASGQVQVRVANSGDVNIDAATDVVIYATTTGSLAGAVEVGRATQQRLNVAGGKDTQVRVDVQLPAAAGDYQWLAVVDAGSDIAETNETNNALLGGDVSVGEPFIDLSAAVAKLKVKKSQPGGKGIIKVSVANLGNTAAEGRITLQAFASIGEVVGVDALQLGELADKKIKLKPGQVKTLKIRLQLPSDIAAGDYHVLAVVERDDRIAVLEDPTQYGFNNTALADDTFSIAA